MPELESKKMIMVDNSFVVVVDEEKALLANELLKHYTPRMSAKAKEERAAGKAPDIKEFVKSSLDKIGLECTILPVFSSLLIEEAPHAAQTPATSAAAKQDPAPEKTPSAENSASPKAAKGAPASNGFQNPMMQ